MCLPGSGDFALTSLTARPDADNRIESESSIAGHLRAIFGYAGSIEVTHAAHATTGSTFGIVTKIIATPH